MSNYISLKNKEKNFIELIEKILVNRNIEADDQWWEAETAKQEIHNLLHTSDYYIGNSLNMSINSEELLILSSYKDDGASKNLYIDIKETIKELLKVEYVENDKVKIVNLVFVTENMRKRIKLQNLFDSKNKKELRNDLIKFIKSQFNMPVKMIINYFYVIDNASGREEIKITDINRYDIIEMPPVKNHINWQSDNVGGKELRGYVLSVNLFQLIEIYNDIGDKLFEKNVRFGISEQFGVDKAIKDTLKKEPDKFWFRNNGITILEEKSDFKLDRSNEILLGCKDNGGKTEFSIINGAQTITAAAEFFYSEENLAENEVDEKKKKDILERLNKAKKAQVMLRIIHVPQIESANKDATDIGIALNRQKPIQAEDIAFTLLFVEKLVTFMDSSNNIDDKEYIFQLVKRGENSINDCSIDLVDFARARKACAMKPGDARSKGSKALLSIAGGDDGYFQFVDKDIFPDEWIDAVNFDEEKIFNKYYKAINFTAKLASIYEKNMKNIDNIIENNNQWRVILNNGKWYFVALVVFILNHYNSEDYTKFEGKLGKIPNDITKVMISFAENLDNFMGNQKHQQSISFDSNTFKKNILFELLLQELLSNKSLENFKAKVISIINSNEAVVTFEEKNKSTRAKGIKVKTVILNKEIKSVKDNAEAFVYTTEKLLNQFDFDEIQLIENTSSWLTNNIDILENNNGYFKFYKEINLKNKTYYIGTNTNSSRKYIQIEELCTYLKVPHEFVYWYTTGEGTSVFEW